MCTDLSHWIRVSIHEVHVPVAQKKKTNPVTVGPVELVGTQWSGTRRRQDAARDCRRRRRVILHFVDEWKRNGMNPQRNADDTRRTNPVARENQVKIQYGNAVKKVFFIMEFDSWLLPGAVSDAPVLLGNLKIQLHNGLGSV